MGNSDTHLKGQIGVPHTVVLADELSTSAVLAGIRAGHSWIAGSATIDLSLHAFAADRCAAIGDKLGSCGEPALVQAVISGVPSGTVSFHTQQGTVHRASLPAGGPGTIEWSTSAADSAFVRVEVRNAEKQMAALTNPVILT